MLLTWPGFCVEANRADCFLLETKTEAKSGTWSLQLCRTVVPHMCAFTLAVIHRTAGRLVCASDLRETCTTLVYPCDLVSLPERCRCQVDLAHSADDAKVPQVYECRVDQLSFQSIN